jgi:hypothetical protein
MQRISVDQVFDKACEIFDRRLGSNYNPELHKDYLGAR